jgi:hypothetical protein
MATTHADVINADLLAFIKSQGAYRSGVAAALGIAVNRAAE